MGSYHSYYDFDDKSNELKDPSHSTRRAQKE